MPNNHEPFKMSVSGQGVIPRLAERATLTVQIQAEKFEKDVLIREVTAIAKDIRTLLEAMSPPRDQQNLSKNTERQSDANSSAAVAHWNMTALRTTQVPTRDRYGNAKPDKPSTCSATVDFTIRFRDFAALGPFATRLAAFQHVRINSVAWTLTDSTQDFFHSELRRLAAVDALQKARDYAEALGLRNVRPVELVEGGITVPGSYQHFSAGNVGYTRKRKAAAPGANTGSGESDELEIDGLNSDLVFQPEEIKMSTNVTCKFEAD